MFDFKTGSNFFFEYYNWIFSQFNFDNFTFEVDSSLLTHHYGYDMANRKEPNEDIMLKNDAGQPIIAFVAKMKMVTIFG